ncbi:MAG: extracellular solute-binding protein [Caldilineaceae bacterium]
MKYRTFRFVGLVSWLLILLLVSVACGGGDDSANGAAGTDSATGVTQLQLMGWSSSAAEDEQLNSVVDAFNEANPEIQVSVNLVPSYDERLQASLAGGTPPDAFYIDSVRLPDYVAAGALEPYESHAVDPEDFYESLRTAFTINGTFYCPLKTSVRWG